MVEAELVSRAPSQYNSTQQMCIEPLVQVGHSPGICKGEHGCYPEGAHECTEERVTTNTSRELIIKDWVVQLSVSGLQRKGRLLLAKTGKFFVVGIFHFQKFYPFISKIC